MQARKRVQFSDKNRAYSPIPMTPSPSRSACSLPSSPDIRTPSPEYREGQASTAAYLGTPYPQVQFELDPMDPVVAVGEEEEKEDDLEIHRCLAYTAYGQPPEFSHDLSSPPVLYQDLPLHEPATMPPMGKLIVICPEHFEWNIPVKPSSSYPGSFVTVDDVLNCMYRELRLPVTQPEYDSLGPKKQGVDAAYFSRVSRITDLEQRNVEARKGVKRIDFLLGRNRFMGLARTHNGPDMWELNVS